MMWRSMLIIFAMVLFFWSTFAQSSDQTDCNDLGWADPAVYPNTVVKSLVDQWKEELEIFTDQDMSVALSHLQQYCCSTNQLTEERCNQIKIPWKKYFPESPYIFDHLMYVWMKKMDWIQEHCDQIWISCETRKYAVSPVTWREEITTIWENTKWYPPSLILEKWRLYRWQADSVLDPNKRTIYKAYNWMCNDIVNIRNSVGNNSWVSDLLVSWGKNISTLCEETINRRYWMESSYVRSLQLEKWTKYFVDNMKSYMKDYFIESRMSDLVTKYASMNSCFTMVLKYVQKTSCCND